jgi:hypothetical protein
MTNLKTILFAVLLVCLLVIPLGACQSEYESETGGEVTNAEEARDTVMDYLHEIEPANIPANGLTWSEEGIAPEGLVGSTTKLYKSDGWMAGVVSPVVAPENIAYRVTITNEQNGWYWQGKVKPNGDIIEKVPLAQISRDSSMAIARDFVINSSTFAYDGMEETLLLVYTRTERQAPYWIFIFEFDSRAAGYGNRTGMTLAQVITHHEAVIKVELNEVVSAIMDEQWDMLRQEEID